ncbi:MAG: putative membrane protein [Mariniblastus sp.]|jgi:uncharacterized membrane protein
MRVEVTVLGCLKFTCVIMAWSVTLLGGVASVCDAAQPVGFPLNVANQDEGNSSVEPEEAESAQVAEAAEQANSTGPKHDESSDADTDTDSDSEAAPWITNDAIIFGILMSMLGLIFWTSNSDLKFFKVFYKVIPMLLVCYFLPSLLTFFGIVDHKASSLYYVATRYLLPATLVLLTLSIDLGEIFKLGPKALIMFLTGTFGVIVGGPIAVLFVAAINPDIIGVDGPAAVWRGLSTVAGSWIGGGANQAAMQVVFMKPEVGASGELTDKLDELYSVMVAVDVFVAEVWMFILLLGVGKADAIDRLFKADASSIERLKIKMESFSKKVARIPTATDLMVIGAIGFGATAIAHLGGTELGNYFTGISESTRETGVVENGVEQTEKPYLFLKQIGLASSFFWLIVISTTIGILLSFTRARNYEGAGASKLGTVFIFILVAVIGMGMDIRAVVEHPGLFLVGGIWMLVHVSLLIFVGWLIRAPYFFLAVGSKANIGGAASAPVVAAAFHPSLAPVGVLLAVLGYALGTYGAMVCAWMMQMATP